MKTSRVTVGAGDDGMTGRATKNAVDDPLYGWQATIEGIDRAIADLAEAIEQYIARDREDWRSVHSIASKVSVATRTLDGHLSHLARLSYARED